MAKKFFLFIPFIFTYLVQAQDQDLEARWVDSVFQTLSTQEKIGQLFIIPINTHSDGSKAEQIIKSYKPGGVFITQGGPISHVTQLNKLQKLSAVPMLVSVEAEWGLAQTLDSVPTFQKPLTLGAVTSTELVKNLGLEVARQMNVLGIHLNLAPHADFVATLPEYPLSLNYFSDNPKRAGEKAIAFVQGLQEGNVLAAAKHGHRYYASALKLAKDAAPSALFGEIDTVGLQLFKTLSDAGVDAILTSHIHLSNENAPTEPADLFVSEVLRTKLNFKGLIIGELKQLNGIIGKPDGELEKIAFQMGHDMLIGPGDFSDAVKTMARAIKKDDLLEKQLDETVRKILTAKYRAGLNTYQPASTDNLLTKLHSPNTLLLKHQLAEASVTLVKNENQTVPIALLEGKTFASLSLGKSPSTEFANYLDKYARFKHIEWLPTSVEEEIYHQLRDAQVIVVALYFNGVKLSEGQLEFLNTLAKEKEVIVCNFGDPRTLNTFTNFPTILTAYSHEDWSTKIAAQLIFGGLPAQGQLPLTLNELWPTGTGISTEPTNRFAYSLPEAAGLDSKTLAQIDDIVREAIDSGATPGSHVLVARKGKVVFEKSYGWHTYENQIPVTDKTIYDLASVTKVSATLQTVMFMQEKGLIDINKKASVYLPELKKSNKKDFTLKDILTHQAGLWPFLPFWAETVKEGSPLTTYYNYESNIDYPFPVADSLFASKAMKDSLWNWIVKARIREKPARTVYDYRYSDMGFYILQHLAEKILNQPMEDFLDQNFYEPLGAYTLGYLPLTKFPPEQIAPTEDDKLFRKKLLTGYVHDQGAAMHGNIAGHAGLFGNANDLAKLGQMLLQSGSYGGQQFFKPETVNLFTAKQYETSRRGLGWDKPTLSDWNGPTTLYASGKTFGHTGFTGTCIWVDPEFDLVFIFLSNRVHPDMTNNKLLNANIRPRVQEVIYKAIFNYCQ